MARELWKGAIQFGLVHIPVSLFPAEQNDELSFTMLDKRDLQPVGYKRFNKSTGSEVPFDEIVKGYEVDEGRFVTLEKEDFKAANVEATQTVDIVGFVEKEQLPAFFYESPYYLGPGKRGEKGYALLREVLVRTGRIGIATVVIRTRAHLAALYPVEDMLVLNTLRFMNEIRDPSQVEVPDLEGAKVSPREIEMAERLVEDMEMKWDPAKYHDTYRDDLLKLIEQKSHGKLKKAKAPRATKGAEVIDFAALLEKSLAGKGKAKAPAVKAKRKPGSSRAATSRRAA